MGEGSYADDGPVVFIKYLGEGDSADAERGMEEGYSEMDGMNPGAQDAYADQIPLIYPSEEEAPIDEAPMDDI